MTAASSAFVPLRPTPGLPSTAPVGIVGAGAMGAGIAQVAALAGHPVVLFDANPGALDRGHQGIAQDLASQVEKGRLSAEVAAATLGRLTLAGELAALADCALVVEAIVERLEVKQTLFRELEARVRPDAILATNTSSLSITAIAAPLAHPARVVGMHFFNPATRMKLVEIVSGLESSVTVAETLHATATAWGKIAVYARSTPGFIVNRIARPFYAEGLRALAEGAADVATLDALVRESGGFPMGPFELMDLIGHDVNFAVTQSVFDATFGDRRYTPSLIQQELVRAGRLGRKTGRGFYAYGPGAEKPTPREEAGRDPLARVRVVGSLGVATPLVTRLEAAGIEVSRAEAPAGSTGGWLEMGPARVMLSDGRAATRRAVEEDHPHLVLFDLALDYATTPRLGLCRADQCGDAAFRAVCATFARAGLRCSPLDDTAGLIVLRIVTMLVNEAADAVGYGLCTPEAVDTAMRYGVNYPRGPVAWGDALGLAYFARVIANLQAHYGEERYRTATLIQRMGWTGAAFHDRSVHPQNDRA